MNLSKIGLFSILALILSCEGKHEAECNNILYLNESCFVCMQLPEGAVISERRFKGMPILVKIPNGLDTASVLISCDTLNASETKFEPISLIEEKLSRAFKSQSPPEYESIQEQKSISLARIYQSDINQTYFGGIYTIEDKRLLKVNCYGFNSKSEILNIFSNINLQKK